MHLLSKAELIFQYMAHESVFTNLNNVFGEVQYSYLDTLQALPIFPLQKKM